MARTSSVVVMVSAVLLGVGGTASEGPLAASRAMDRLQRPPAEAAVTFTILSRESPSFDGQTFGAAGQYETLRGTVAVELDPTDARNAIITDLSLAPRLPNGRIRYVTTVAIAKPVDMTKASGLLVHTNSNRGGGSPGASASGDVEVMVGWQADLPSSATNRVVEAPVARHPDGADITGIALARIANMAPGTSTATLQVLGRDIPDDADMNQAAATLIRKESETRNGVNGPTITIPTMDWAFADCRAVPFPGTPDPRRVCLRNGFDPGHLYELTYHVRNPVVLGVGLAAIRDVNAFLRYETRDAAGAVNPLAGRIRKAIVNGTSQSGNVLKTFINLGFNEDLAGRIVFDGANPHIAGRQTAINVRFGLPSGSGTLYEPGGEGVLWWEHVPDNVRFGREPAGLLDRCRRSNTCPKVFETFGAAEFVGRLMTVALTGTDAQADLPLPSNVRRYYFPGTTHGGGNGGFTASAVARGECALPANPNSQREQMAALRVALSEWVLTEREPPPSRYPMLRDRTLVAATADAMGFPAIPGVARPDGLPIGLMDYDFGNEFRYNDLSGVITKQPPSIRRVVTAMMPTVDRDGNEVSGYPSVLHQAPLGTYTGWNPTAGGFFHGQPCGGGLTGAFIPFTTTRAERLAAGDSRLSLEERYGTKAGYVCAVTAATRLEVSRRMLLPADAARLIEQARSSEVLPSAASSAEATAVADRLCRAVL